MGSTSHLLLRTYHIETLRGSTKEPQSDRYELRAGGSAANFPEIVVVVKSWQISREIAILSNLKLFNDAVYQAKRSILVEAHYGSRELLLDVLPFPPPLKSH